MTPTYRHITDEQVKNFARKASFVRLTTAQYTICEHIENIKLCIQIQRDEMRQQRGSFLYKKNEYTYIRLLDEKMRMFACLHIVEAEMNRRGDFDFSADIAP